MATEDFLFPLSPTGNVEQRLDDSMECAVDMLLGENSLFNDSLEDIVHDKAIRAAFTEPGAGAQEAPGEEERDLNDSLDFDATQLPFEAELAKPCVRGSHGNNHQKVEFQVAVNVPVFSPSDENTSKKEMMASDAGTTLCMEAEMQKKIDLTDEIRSQDEQIKGSTSNSPSRDSAAKSSPVATPSDSGVVSNPTKVVPSFGQKKKAVVSPTAAKSSNAVQNSNKKLDKGTLAQEKPQAVPTPTEAEHNKENCEEDQCVPGKATTTEATQKPKFSAPNSKSLSKSAGSSEEDIIPNTTAAHREPLGKAEKKLRKNSESVVADKEKKKKAELELKNQEREEKKKEAEKKKEQEREQKKREAEEKKAEKERVKRERQLEVERKKAEREQKKIEQELKKTERTNNREGKQVKRKSSKKAECSEGSDDTKGKDSGSKSTSSDTVAQSTEQDEEQTAAMKQDSLQPKEQGDLQPERKENDGSSASTVNTRDHDSAGDAVEGGVTRPEENAALLNASCDPESTSAELEIDTARKLDPDESDSDKCASGTADTGGLPESSEEPTEGAKLPSESGDVGACDVVLENLDERRGSQNPEGKSVDGGEFDQGNEDRTSNTAEQVSKGQGEKIKIVFGTSTNTQKKSSAIANEKPAKALKVKTVGVDDERSKSEKAPTSTKSKTGGQARQGVKKTVKKPKVPQTESKTAAASNSKSVKSKQKKKRTLSNKDSGGNTGGDASDVDAEPDSKRSKPTNYTGPVWVQCERSGCQKWRQLRGCSDPLSLPHSWNCSMNTDQERNSCSAPEEQWSDEGDSQEYVESPYIPGSLVWAKMDGYPWWPAMVEEDPNEEAYYQMGERRNASNIPVKFHVVFFDTPVSRGWVSHLHIHPYTEDQDQNTRTGVSVSQKLRRTFKEARKQATRAVSMPITTRLIECSFAKRFRRMSSRKRKTADRDGDADSSFSSRVKTPKTTSSSSSSSTAVSSSRKSSRLRTHTSMAEREEEGGGERGMGGGHPGSSVNTESTSGVTAEET